MKRLLKWGKKEEEVRKVFIGKFVHYPFNELYLVKTEDNQYQRINFDIDEKGGLKIIYLYEHYSTEELTELEKTDLELEKGQTFLKIRCHEDSILNKIHYEEEVLFITNETINDILNTKYLKHKYKYFVLDGLIIKVGRCEGGISIDSHCTSIDPTFYAYRLEKEC